jgi:hypothetical protein
MKRVIIISSVILLVANILFGAILLCYNGFNVAISSVVVLLTAAMLYVVNCIMLKDAFKVSLSILFTLSGFIEFVISLFMPSRLSDNLGVIVIIILMAIQGLILFMSNTVSTKIR